VSTPRAPLALLTAAFLFAAACGQGEEPPAAPPPPPPPAKPDTPPWEKRHEDPAVAEIQKFVEEQMAAGRIDRRAAGWKERLPMPPKAAFRTGARYFWRLETNRGPLLLRLLPEVAPMHVSNAIYLTVLGFYDGLRFHRVVEGFMAQGGDPRGDGTGGPGYAYAGEIDPDVRHDRRGVVSTANRGPGTDGSQFFVMFGPNRGLDGKHTIFARLVEGEDTLKAIEALAGPLERDGVPPRAPILVERATVVVE
jgi:cyclophilin family peptidyl-prolyl cis-trans isomerase